MRTDDILGKRFRFTGGEAPDMTIVAVDPIEGTVKAHTLGGHKQVLMLSMLVTAIENGAIEESTAGAPFVIEARAEVRDDQQQRFYAVRRNGRTLLIPVEKYR